jgi:restriction system protein
MTRAWMVRAGERGYLADEFEQRGFISIGWNGIGDLTLAVTVNDIRTAYMKAYPDAKPGRIGNAVAMIHKFRSVLKPSDHVITYNPTQRKYLVGNIVGDYVFEPGVIKDHPHLRKVDWLEPVSRDQLSVASRTLLGAH